MKRLCVVYKQAHYYNLPRCLSNNCSIRKTETVPSKINYLFEIFETKESIDLVNCPMLFNIDNDIATFSDLPLQKSNLLSFNKITKKFEKLEENPVFSFKDDVVSINFSEKNNNNYYYDTGKSYNSEFIDSNNLKILYMFIYKILNFLNSKIGMAFFNGLILPSYNESLRPANNLFKIMSEEALLAVEKVFMSMGPNYVNNALNSDDGLILNVNGKKLKQVMGLPSNIIQFIKENDMSLSKADGISAFSGYFGTICAEDNNEGIYFINYANKVLAMKTFNKDGDRNYGSAMGSFLAKLAEIKMYHSEIKVAKLIPYLIKQRVYYSFLQYNDISWSRRDTTRDVFDFPVNEAREYLDYLNLGATDYYPKNLTLSHNIISRNSKILENIKLQEKYKTVVQSNEKYCYVNSNYVVTYPKTIEELVIEGNKLEHCVATYANVIANGLTRVFCIRTAANPEEPFVTVEVDENFNILQIREKYDIQVTDPNVLDFANKWKGWAKKK